MACYIGLFSRPIFYSTVILEREIKTRIFKKVYWNSFFSCLLFSLPMFTHKNSTWLSKRTPLGKSWPTAWTQARSRLSQVGCFDRNIICNFYSAPCTALLNSCLHQLTSFKTNNIQAPEHTVINCPSKYLIVATTQGPVGQGGGLIWSGHWCWATPTGRNNFPHMNSQCSRTQ